MKSYTRSIQRTSNANSMSHIFEKEKGWKMDSKRPTQLKDYDSLSDPLLKSFFFAKSIRRNLHRNHLITKKGQILAHPERILSFEAKNSELAIADFLETKGTLKKGTKKLAKLEMLIRYDVREPKASLERSPQKVHTSSNTSSLPSIRKAPLAPYRKANVDSSKMMGGRRSERENSESRIS